jgi:hypothetical protein
MMSVTAVAAAACALWAVPASAAIKHNTTTKITSPSPANVHTGHPYTFHVKVTSSGGTIPRGKVIVAPVKPTGLGAGYSCTATLSTLGTGACAVTPPFPSYGFVYYEARYLGNLTHNPSVSTGTHLLVVQLTTTTTVGPKTATAGSPVNLTATVVDQANADLSPNGGGTGTVAFFVNNVVVPGCSAVAPADPSKGPDNVATCTTTLAKGTPTVSAVYSGDVVNLTSKGQVTITVS